MARGRSVIEVAIIGDVKNLQRAFGEANTATGGLVGSLARGFVGLQVIDKTFDAIGGALDNADELGDALSRISTATSPETAKLLEDMAFSMSNIGLAAPEVATMAANFADLATAAGIAEPTIAGLTPKVIEIARGIAATTGKTIDEVITDIGKAAQGQQKPVSEYGVLIDKALNPDAQILSILEQLEQRYPGAAEAAQGFADKQDILNAKWDNFMTKVGQGLEGPLSGVLDFFTTIIDRDIPNMMDQLGDLGDAFVTFGETVLTPLATINDVLGGIGDTLNNVIGLFGRALGLQSGLSERDAQYARSLYEERNYQSRP